jgi:hypothetical protein
MFDDRMKGARRVLCVEVQREGTALKGSIPAVRSQT